nr:cytochrome B561 and DOMON domain-containing protein At5g47530-like [Ipomoea batatas]
MNLSSASNIDSSPQDPTAIDFEPSSPKEANCMNFDFSGNRVFATWSNLPVLNSVLHWTYHQFNQTVDIAYLHGGVTTSNWVAWGLNVGGSGMRGTQCLGGFSKLQWQYPRLHLPIPAKSTGHRGAASAHCFNRGKTLVPHFPR